MENKRTPNFSGQEEELLLQLVSKYKNILECKTTDSFQNRKKNDTWATVESEFNRNSGSISRTALVLKNKYSNLKKRVIKKVGDEKAGVRGTGGGPYKTVNYDENEKAVCAILGEKRLGRQCSQYDDDSEQFSRPLEKLVTLKDGTTATMVNAMVEEEVDVEDLLEDDPIDVFDDTVVSQEKVKWSGNTTPLLRTKRKECLTSNEGPILTTARKQRFNDQLSCWASGKADLAKVQEQSVAELNSLKMKIMKEESEAKLAREERLSRLQEQEVQLRIDILNMEKTNLKQKLQNNVTY